MDFDLFVAKSRIPISYLSSTELITANLEPLGDQAAPIPEATDSVFEIPYEIHTPALDWRRLKPLKLILVPSGDHYGQLIG